MRGRRTLKYSCRLWCQFHFIVVDTATTAVNFFRFPVFIMMINAMISLILRDQYIKNIYNYWSAWGWEAISLHNLTSLFVLLIHCTDKCSTFWVFLNFDYVLWQLHNLFRLSLLVILPFTKTIYLPIWEESKKLPCVWNILSEINTFWWFLPSILAWSYFKEVKNSISLHLMHVVRCLTLSCVFLLNDLKTMVKLPKLNCAEISIFKLRLWLRDSAHYSSIFANI